MKIITLEELQEKFTLVLNTISEKENLINLELKEIDNYLNYTAPPRRHKMDFHIEPKTDAIFILAVDLNRRKLLKRAFNGFNVYGKFDLIDNNAKSQGMINLDDKVIQQASELAKYFKWLKELDFKPSLAQDKSSLNIEQKLLALHFLGLNFEDYTNSHMAIVLGQILNVGSQNIRGNLSNMYGGKNSLRKIENFEKLTELFENKTFESILNKIKKEIKQLK
ncbi:MAG: hypothetical protein A3F91_11265 [Flavobacteria bacterium RIFCSPLOWO2_12_FULL_35_11]|nr:MAG: hypothetical protein A3F91_11265 [Flavobacteria bacterium RIFCSPLOWO2_12_FULL_35_11]